MHTWLWILCVFWLPDMRADISFSGSYVKSNTMESSLRLWSTISDQ